MIDAQQHTDDAAQMKQEEQPKQVASADRTHTPAANQPNPAVLATGKDYIDKYRPLWRALAE